MKYNQKFVIASILIPLLVVAISSVWKPILWSFVIIIPLLIIGYSDYFQKKHAIKRNFPIIGRMRYLLESLRPEIMQYFIETDTEGTPINRLDRSLIYQRSKDTTDTVPFGTRLDVYEEGYEWMPHSIYALPYDEINYNPLAE